jgi:hypothetical protein
MYIPSFGAGGCSGSICNFVSLSMKLTENNPPMVKCATERCLTPSRAMIYETIIFARTVILTEKLILMVFLPCAEQNDGVIG